MPRRTPPPSNDGLRPAGFPRAITVDDPAFGQIVGRYLEIDPVAGQNLDTVPPQPARDVGQDRLAGFELDRKGRTREYLLDRAEKFERRLFGRFGGFAAGPGLGKRAAARYGRTGFRDVIRVLGFVELSPTSAFARDAA